MPTMILTWPVNDPAPMPGVWLRSAGPRARTDYEITAVKPVRRRDGSPRFRFFVRYRITVERHPRGTAPEGARIELIEWAPRKRRRAP